MAVLLKTAATDLFAIDFSPVGETEYMQDQEVCLV